VSSGAVVTRPADTRARLPRAADLLRPEEVLFFLLVSPEPSKAGARAVLERGVDWSHLLSLVAEEGLAGTAWRGLQSLGLPIPPDIAAQMQGTAALSDFRLGAVHRLLERTIAAYAAAGIEVMLVKGAALSTFYYADPCDRNMADIDLLVPGDRARDAVALAQGIGWSIDEEAYREALYEGHHHLPPMSDTLGLDIRLEIHTDVLPQGHPLHFGADALRGRAETRRTKGGTAVKVPTLEDLLLYSCLHLGWSHEMRDGGWRTFRDVSELIRQPTFSWDRFLALASDRTLAAACYWTLELANRLSGVEIPSRVTDALRPDLPEWAHEFVGRHYSLQLVPLSRLNPSEALSRVLWNVAMRPGRAGHGGARPWDHVERRMERSRRLGFARGADQSQRWWRRAMGIRETLSYVRRLASR